MLSSSVLAVRLSGSRWIEMNPIGRQTVRIPSLPRKSIPAVQPCDRRSGLRGDRADFRLASARERG
jgi:hypothetical protein